MHFALATRSLHFAFGVHFALATRSLPFAFSVYFALATHSLPFAFGVHVHTPGAPPLSGIHLRLSQAFSLDSSPSILSHIYTHLQNAQIACTWYCTCGRPVEKQYRRAQVKMTVTRTQSSYNDVTSYPVNIRLCFHPCVDGSGEENASTLVWVSLRLVQP